VLFGVRGAAETVRHRNHIAEWLLRHRGTPFGQQKCLLVLIVKEAPLRAVLLLEHQVPDRLEPSFLPGFKEDIDPRPSVEHDGNAILL
jgi:hypothetical protein